MLVSDLSRGWPEGSLFNSYYTEVVEEGVTPFPWLLHFPFDPYLIMTWVKQGGIKYFFFGGSLWYYSTWDWTSVSRAIGEHYSLGQVITKPSTTKFSDTSNLSRIFVIIFRDFSKKETLSSALSRAPFL